MCLVEKLKIPFHSSLLSLPQIALKPHKNENKGQAFILSLSSGEKNSKPKHQKSGVYAQLEFIIFFRSLFLNIDI